MPKAILTVGPPASGKTTYARQYVADNPNTALVCRDDIRKAHGLVHNQNEALVNMVHRSQIVGALEAGINVIIADTNVKTTFRKKLIKLAHEYCADVEIVIFDAPVDVLLKRDANREDSVGPEVIRRMHRSMNSTKTKIGDLFLPAPVGSKWTGLTGILPRAVVVDIDGTLAHTDGLRSPYDEAKVLGDRPDYIVSLAVTSFADAANAKVIVVSGRSDACRPDTETWLQSVINFDELHMRKSGDHRSDYIVKNEIYDEHIIPNYDILAAFDDRDQVVRHLRHRGIRVFQVAEGKF